MRKWNPGMIMGFIWDCYEPFLRSTSKLFGLPVILKHLKHNLPRGSVCRVQQSADRAEARTAGMRRIDVPKLCGWLSKL